MITTSIAVIGAGFSGTLLAWHLAHRCPPATRIHLIERQAKVGSGVAYGTENSSHLLNVRAGRMSAFEDRPDDFLDWLRALPEAECLGAAPTADSFVPRRLYGTYLRNRLDEALSTGGRLTLLRGDVVSLAANGEGCTLKIEGGDRVRADLVVLATGNFPPQPLPLTNPAGYATGSYRADPWATDALSALDRAAPVLLIGTGLTTIDVVISLLDQGHTGPIHAISRRGLLPRRHADGAVPVADVTDPLPTGVVALAHDLRHAARRHMAGGGDWRSLLDGMRPFIQDIWQAMSPTDRSRFLRHGRPWWDVHRHRIAGPVADRIDAARASGQFQLHAGNLDAYAPAGEGIEATYRPRGSDRVERLRVARAINCTGPGSDYTRLADPLISGLLAAGTVRPDTHRLGLDVTTGCALVDRAGAISRRLFAVGPVTRGAFWEMTSVPDLRRQCAYLAGRLASLATA
ncbi:MAG TPA: FAD/NAD(P)-binding protein [Stellaceae bacterium]|nr:FAD/NAD(P)-binding protein [Stellaceae bacterium]